MGRDGLQGEKEKPVEILVLREHPDALEERGIPDKARWQRDEFGLRWPRRRLIERTLMLIRQPDGKQFGYETGLCGDRTAVICIVTRKDGDTERIGFVQSYRPFLPNIPGYREQWDAAIEQNRFAAELLGVNVLELPMGFSNPGMNVAESAYREGSEELRAYVSRSSVFEVATIHADPFLSPQHCVVFTMIASDGEAEYAPEELESIQGSEWLTREEVKDAILRGRIRDARSIAALNIYSL